ncbi:uncharacterized protein PV09_02619 [Verruconis gallopava]|uniref:NADH:ubiquinone oxidoreductase intermediate-associated protein 30 domain-containing protein n=1 Tax=Verruconis gallopava TaxID=253628 RepID=A0A0D2AK73_9PEZI|nr:uncharacterized protein PV09_02619 [Verruconis gallopava]KIW06960.1 hypothetical protein PV09_02619 [Verruconis gallopava]
MKEQRLDLFGGKTPWRKSDWIASDDRVRAGKSQSYLAVSDGGSAATFEGTLDVKTLGGAGFASQRTASDDISWDLSDYDGIEMVIGRADEMRYTLTVKDTLLPRDPDTGREQSTISYEHDFKVSPNTKEQDHVLLWIPWDQFRATYRGREKKNAQRLNTRRVRRFGIMCRSFFGDQEGKFEVVIVRISAVKKPTLHDATAEMLDSDFEKLPAWDLEKGTAVNHRSKILKAFSSRRKAFIVVASLLLVSVWIFCKACPGVKLKGSKWLGGNYSYIKAYLGS